MLSQQRKRKRQEVCGGTGRCCDRGGTTCCEDCERHLHRYANDTNNYYYKLIGRQWANYMRHTNMDDCNHAHVRHMIHFFTDKQHQVDSDDGQKDLRLRTPFCCLLAGKSQCGKTQLMINILEQWRHITDDHDGQYTKRIFWFYGTLNDLQLSKVKDIYDKYRREISSSSSSSSSSSDDADDSAGDVLQFIDGSNKIKMKEIIMKAENAIMVLDDLMNEISKDDDLLSLFTRESHHKRLCIFYMWQDIFPKQKNANAISKNTQYKILFNNPTQNLSFKTMITHMFPTNSKKVYDKIQEYMNAQPKDSYPYVLIRTEANADKEIMFTVNSISRDPHDLLESSQLFTKPPEILSVC